MELRHLRYFVALAEELNFTRAAKKLRLAQPSLTRQIRNLEDELGVRLLERTRNGVLLTEQGHFFLGNARRLVALSLETVRTVQEFRANGSGHLNIGYIPRFDSELLPATLAEFQQTHPEIGVTLRDMPPADQFRALEGRTMDVGFPGLRPDDAGSALNWRCVARHDVLAILPVRHVLAGKMEVDLAEFRELPFVAMSEQTHPGWQKWVSNLCKDAGFTPKIVQEVSSEADILNFVSERLGVALASDRIKKLPHQDVTFRPIRAAPRAKYWMTWRRDNPSDAMGHYIALIEKRASAFDHS